MNLVVITEDEYDVIIDLAYATKNNFTNNILYDDDKCYLVEEAAKKLKETISFAKILGYKIKLLDAYRPLKIQKKLWEKYPDPSFISNPETGTLPHCRGIAVDLTLCNKDGQEINMGTEFDSFSKKSYHGSVEMPKDHLNNRVQLTGIMTSCGWQYNPNEWWHYQLYNYSNYDIL